MGVYIKTIDVVVFQSSYISGPCDLYTAVLVLFQGSPVSGPHGLYLCTIVVLHHDCRVRPCRGPEVSTLVTRCGVSAGVTCRASLIGCRV